MTLAAPSRRAGGRFAQRSGVARDRRDRIAPFIGSTPIAFGAVFAGRCRSPTTWTRRSSSSRGCRASLAAALVGGTLAAAGVVFQALLRNALATPYTLGVSAGASLGAMLAITFGSVAGRARRRRAARAWPARCWRSWSSTRWPAPAIAGLSTTVLLLAGVTLNAFFSALILFVQYLSDFAETFRALRWLMGDLDVAGYAPIVGRAAVRSSSRSSRSRGWRGRSTCSASAPMPPATRGVNVVRAQRVAFFCASLATGAAVSVGGPIGFIGIIVPHLVRLMVGADHRLVLPASIFFGAAFLVLCDVLARTVLAPIELPVGIITALIGGPFFLWMLVRKR